MNGTMLSRVVDFMSRLLQGGTFELVLFVILVILAILVAILLIFIAWKLIVLLAKGLLWLGANALPGRHATTCGGA